jgi:hypothetical protein
MNAQLEVPRLGAPKEGLNMQRYPTIFSGVHVPDVTYQGYLGQPRTPTIAKSPSSRVAGEQNQPIIPKPDLAETTAAMQARPAPALKSSASGRLQTMMHVTQDVKIAEPGIVEVASAEVPVAESSPSPIGQRRDKNPIVQATSYKPPSKVNSSTENTNMNSGE